jgi:hypothetical protein
MTDEIVSLIKDIVDKAGLDISIQQIETGLNDIADDEPKEDPLVVEIIRKIEEKQKAKRTDKAEDKGNSMMGWDNCYFVSGPARLEYSGRTTKSYEGDAALLLKPDHSIVVHGLRGVNPVCYMARAKEIWSRGKGGQFTIEAVAGGERLIVTFLKIEGFDSLFREERLAEAAPVLAADRIELTAEEKTLEARLKQLRIYLAGREGISYLPAVFDNRMIYQLVRQKPKTLEELKQIRGFGKKRIERYAASVLETINGGGGNQANA